MNFDFNNGRPIYIQLVEQLKQKIVTGEYPIGSKIPSVRDLALQMQVNPNTMQKALQQLEEEGILYTKRTSGKFVSKDSAKVKSWKQRMIQEKVNTFLVEMDRLSISKEEILAILKEEGKNEKGC